MLGPVPPRTKKTFPGLLLCVSALLGLGAAACADEQADSEADISDEDTQDLALEHNAAGVRFAQVTANGTGCPRGSWRGTVARDGSSVSLRFSSFSGEASRRRPVVVKDCNLAIKLSSGESLSYALEDLHTSGRAYLRDGANLALSSKAYWQGNPAQSVDTSLTLSGRFDDDFRLGARVPESARVWSPCGVQRDLNVVTRARLQSTGDSYGYFEVSRIGDVKIAIKRCGDAQPDGGPVDSDAGTPDADVPDADVPDADVPDADVPDADVPDADVPDTSVPDAEVPSDGPTVTSVSANGTGCPAGSATSTIAPDGQTFTVAFSQFTGTVDENTAFTVKDCNLAIQVSSPAGQTYAVESLNLRGTSTLGAGANLVASTNYYFQGNPAVSASQSTTLTGPYDQPLDITHQYGDAAPAAPCGAARDLNAVIRLRLQNGTPRTTSSFTLGSAGNATFRLRACN